MNEADNLARRVAETLLQREGTGSAWGVAIDDAREGYACIRMKLRDDMLNGHRIGHGGMIFALADTAFAYACNSRNENIAQNISISFRAGATGDVLSRRRVKFRGVAVAAFIRLAPAARVMRIYGLSKTIGGSVIN